jgi:hypothetical protein
VAFEDDLEARRKKDDDDDRDDPLFAIRARAKAEDFASRRGGHRTHGFDFPQEGSDATGYRVRARPRVGVPDGAQAAAYSSFGGGHVIAATVLRRSASSAALIERR